METTIAYTTSWATLLSLLQADSDILPNLPKTGVKVTFINRSTSEPTIKRTGLTSAPTNNNGLTLDSENNGVWYITMDFVDFSTCWIKGSANGSMTVSFEEE